MVFDCPRALVRGNKKRVIATAKLPRRMEDSRERFCERKE
jgi:hypothetical protein